MVRIKWNNKNLQGANCGLSHVAKLILNLQYPELFDMNFYTLLMLVKPIKIQADPNSAISLLKINIYVF